MCNIQIWTELRGFRGWGASGQRSVEMEAPDFSLPFSGELKQRGQCLMSDRETIFDALPNFCQWSFVAETLARFGPSSPRSFKEFKENSALDKNTTLLSMSLKLPLRRLRSSAGSWMLSSSYPYQLVSVAVSDQISSHHRSNSIMIFSSLRSLQLLRPLSLQMEFSCSPIFQWKWRSQVSLYNLASPQRRSSLEI